MSVVRLTDRALPGLAEILDPIGLEETLRRAFLLNRPDLLPLRGVHIERYRYRPGERAIVQFEVVGRDRRIPGAVWIFAGTKAAKLVGRAPTARGRSTFLTPSDGLVELFPYDRSVPEITAFIEQAPAWAEKFLGGPQSRAPQLARYRPGLGATFYWRSEERRAYTKIYKQCSPLAEASLLDTLRERLAGTSCAVPRVIGAVESEAMLVLEAIEGTTLARQIMHGSPSSAAAATSRAIGGLRALHSLPTENVTRAKTAQDLLDRSCKIAVLLAAVCPDLGKRARKLVCGLEARIPMLDRGLAHMDMKAEHTVLRGEETVLLDLDSLALGDPLYDFAMLESRIVAMAIAGHASWSNVDAALQALGFSVGADIEGRRYLWLRTVALLQVTRFMVQHPAPGWRKRALEVIALCESDGRPTSIS